MAITKIKPTFITIYKNKPTGYGICKRNIMYRQTHNHTLINDKKKFWYNLMPRIQKIVARFDHSIHVDDLLACSLAQVETMNPFQKIAIPR